MLGVAFYVSSSFKKKIVLWSGILFGLLLGLSFWVFYIAPVRTAVVLLPLVGRVIVLDPGHGGYDPGMVKDGILEKDIVLDISLLLREMLQKAGAVVIMTREKDEDLLVVPAGPKKREDLANRLKIIKESRAEIFVSIHANAIHSPHWRGAQTFYYEGQEKSKILAGCIQEVLVELMKNTEREIKAGDYFLLRNSPVPAVIVEVGFMSNPVEMKLLVEPSYQKKIAWCIYLGIVRYTHEGN